MTESAAGAADPYHMMPRPRSRAEQRRNPRQVRRIPCELFLRGVRHSAVVKDISRGGVFVQTAAKAAVGTPVTLVVAPAAGRTEIRVAGRIVRADPGSAQSPDQEGTIGIGIEVMETGSLGRLLHDPRFVDGPAELPEAAQG